MDSTQHVHLKPALSVPAKQDPHNRSSHHHHSPIHHDWDLQQSLQYRLYIIKH